MLDVLGLIARTCWNGRNALARSCKALSAQVDPAVFSELTVTDDLIKRSLPNGIRHGMRVERVSWSITVSDYRCGMIHEMIVYTPRHHNSFPRMIDFVATNYDSELWTRRIVWVYRRVRFVFEDNAWPDGSSALNMAWDRNGCIDGIVISGRTMAIHAGVPSTTKTVTREEIIAWVEAKGYVPADADEREPSEYIDSAL